MCSASIEVTVYNLKPIENRTAILCTGESYINASLLVSPKIRLYF